MKQYYLSLNHTSDGFKNIPNLQRLKAKVNKKTELKFNLLQKCKIILNCVVPCCDIMPYSRKLSHFVWYIVAKV